MHGPCGSRWGGGWPTGAGGGGGGDGLVIGTLGGRLQIWVGDWNWGLKL